MASNQPDLGRPHQGDAASDMESLRFPVAVVVVVVVVVVVAAVVCKGRSDTNAVDVMDVSE